jgi:hypothetical protein
MIDIAEIDAVDGDDETLPLIAVCFLYVHIVGRKLIPVICCLLSNLRRKMNNKSIADRRRFTISVICLTQNSVIQETANSIIESYRCNRSSFDRAIVN